jgi:hypothetical protein
MTLQTTSEVLDSLAGFTTHWRPVTKSWAVTGPYSEPSLFTHLASLRRWKVQVRPSSEVSQLVARAGCTTPYLSYSTRVSMTLAAGSNSRVVPVYR